jgi:hypothetical protein
MAIAFDGKSARGVRTAAIERLSDDKTLMGNSRLIVSAADAASRPPITSMGAYEVRNQAFGGCQIVSGDRSGMKSLMRSDMGVR